MARSPHQHAWYGLAPADVERRLGSGPGGLTDAEAAARLARHGPNHLEEAPPPSALAILLHQFTSPLIYILLLATVVTAVLREYVDAAVIAAVMALNAIIGFTQERKAEMAVRALMGLVAPRARVIRGGREMDLESRSLVPGDLVLLESGTRVPADIRLVAATGLTADESMLTGESVPVAKHAAPLDAADLPPSDRANMVHAGAIIARGRGRGYVVATGRETELGAIVEHVRREEPPKTPLQQRMDRFARIVGLAVAASALAALGVGVALGESLAEMFMVAVALAVSAVPEGLPVVLTIALAVGVREMARRNAIIRRLPAVETLGSTTVIGSDKTGTMTENRMTVEAVWAGGEMIGVGGDGRLGAGGVPEVGPIVHTLLAGVLTNEAVIVRSDGEPETRGDPTETALLVAAARLGVDPEEVRARAPVLAEIPFEPDRQYSATLRRHGGEPVLFVKGAPERVLDMCTSMLRDVGPGDLDRDAVHRAAQSMTSRGLRVLAMASRTLPAAPAEGDELPEPEGLTFLGLQGMRDPPRAGVREAIAGCREAGIRVVMITGDHALTARAIAAELGIGAPDAPVLVGAELEKMDDAALDGRVDEVSVYARVTPEHKLRVVRALQRRGQVVAVTGDGVNDAPALRAAEIGIAMGRSGTDVAREASDMVLADDNFVSIYAAVEQGRITFDNVRRVTFFLISTGAAEVLCILTTLVLGWPLPFLPAQILWLNLVTNGLQDVALAFEPGEPDVLKRPPRRADEGIVSRLLWERTLLSGMVMAAGTLWMFRWQLDLTGSLAEAQTKALTTMVLYQMFQAGNARSDARSVFRMPLASNPFLLMAAAAALAVHVAALYLPFTQFVLRFDPVELEAWPRMILVASTLLAVVEVHKAARRRWRLT
jgi:cation-transporting ATPase F